MFAKFIAMMSLFAAGVAIGVLTMIHGWGLEPKSWWWIIGAGIGMRFIALVMEQVVKKEDGKE